MKRFFALLCSVVLLSGCTPEIRSYGQHLGKEITTYDYSQLWEFVTFGAAPGKKRQREENLASLCLHEDTENRVITGNGVNDEVWYKRCTMSGYPPSPPQRFKSRPDLPPDGRDSY